MAEATATSTSATQGGSSVVAGLPFDAISPALLLDRLIILIAFISIGIIIFRVSKVILAIKDPVEFEVRKIRFASVTFTGIMVLLVFVSLLYFLDRQGGTAGQAIFEKTITALTPLAGAIIGYLFGGRSGGTSPGQPSDTPNTAASDPQQNPTRP